MSELYIANQPIVIYILNQHHVIALNEWLVFRRCSVTNYGDFFTEREYLEKPKEYMAYLAAENSYSKCGDKCELCYKFVLEKKSFICHAAKAKFTIRRDSTGTTKNVIYLAFCKQCSKHVSVLVLTVNP